MKIAIIDSGLSEFLNSKSDSISGISITQKQDGSITYLNNFEDNNGHGNMGFQVISHEIKKIQYQIIKILDKDNSTSIELLLEALRYVNTGDAKIVILGLASRNQQYNIQIQNEIDTMFYKGKIVISSLMNGENYSIPASLNKVIGVSGAYFNRDILYFNKFEEIQCFADDSPVFCEYQIDKIGVFKGNSKATALFTAHVARELQNNPSYTFNNIQDSFHKRSNNQILSNMQKDDPYFYNERNEQIDKYLYSQILSVLESNISSTILTKKDFEQYPIWHLLKKMDNIIDFLNNLLTTLKISKSKAFIKMNDLYSIDNLYYRISKLME